MKLAFLIFLLAAAVFGLDAAHAANGPARISSSVRFLQSQQEDSDFANGTSMFYEPCYPCGPNGFTTTPSTDLTFVTGETLDNGEPYTCEYIYNAVVNGNMATAAECPFVTMIFNEWCGCASAPTVSPAPTISAGPTASPSASPAPSAAPCSFCAGTDPFEYIEIDYDNMVDVPALGGMVPCWYIHEYSYWGLNSNGEFYDYYGNVTTEGSPLTCEDVQSYGKECGCPPTEPTASPAPTNSAPPSVSPSASPAPSAAPCNFCAGTDPFEYIEIDYDNMVDVPALGGMVPCWYIQEYSDWGLNSNGEFYDYYDNVTTEGSPLTCEDVQSYGKECGCPPTEPTASPAPTNSAPPSVSPSASPAPSAAPCNFCAGTDPFEIDYDNMVDVPALGGMVPCWYIHEYLYWGLNSNGEFYDYYGNVTTEGSPLTCEDVQSYGKECGCPPTEPTASPAPTNSAPPSVSPSASPAPSAAPCNFCAGTDPFEYIEIDYDNMVDVPALGGLVPCWYIQAYSDWGLNSNGEFYDYYGNVTTEGSPLTCEVVQSYGRECGCPQTEPTASPAPTLTSPPSVTPSVSPAPSAPCSCEGSCNGSNSECGCWCDHICESLGDCCADVKDYCEFGDAPSAPLIATSPVSEAPISDAPVGADAFAPSDSPITDAPASF